MWEWLTGVAYYAHGYCLSWDPWLIGLHAGSDFAIFASYAAISIAILIFLHKRPRLELKILGRLFAAFIFWCGLTHFVSILTLWAPIYDVEAAVKVVTAVISLVTAVAIYFLIPRALAIPSAKDLQVANARLTSEVAAHKGTLDALRLAHDQLETRVAERTASLKASAEHAELLVREVAHRSGNLMSVIAAMARQSARTSNSPDQLAEQLAGRIEGMGRSHGLLFRRSWRSVDLESLIREQLSPFVGSHQLILTGSPVLILPQAANTLGMALYELATNSLKYGALSAERGQVSVGWGITDESDPVFWVEWSENGGPRLKAPTRKGWGTRVLAEMTSSSLNGNASLSYAEEGLVWTLRVPAAGTVAELMASE